MTTQDTPGLSAPTGARNVPLGNLRTALILLVVAHHAVLAYHPYAPPPASSLASQPMLWPAFPIVDSQRWPGVDLFVGWNDTFFMSLLFLLAGVFTWPSLRRKGAAGFLGERARRLGLPFVVSAALLAPLAYYPTYLATGADPSPVAFARQWLALGVWPAGPAWFLWVLLVFAGVAALLTRLSPDWGEALGRLSGRLSRHPAGFLAALVTVSAVAYLPLAATFSPESWGHLGPFWVQSSRVLCYAVYFFAGAGLGAFGLDRGLLAADGKLARRWWLWVVAAVAAFALAVAAFLAILGSLPSGGPGAGLAAFGNFTFVLCCACSTFASLALFLRFAGARSRIFDILGANAYGIYLLHYVCVTWLQLALLDVALPGAAKGALVFAGALALSLGLTAALRRVPAIARVI